MSATMAYRWRANVLEPVDDCALGEVVLHAADSWLVDDGTVLALELHRERFASAIEQSPLAHDRVVAQFDGFWEAAIAAIPREGRWFPRVELRTVNDAPALSLLLRPAPELRREIRLATWRGRDPRSAPRIKGPDLAAMMRLRGEAQDRGADEMVLLSPDGYVVEGTTSALCWWVGDHLGMPAAELPRVDSVTMGSIGAIAAATGVELVHEHVTPTELAGRELWAVNALHGIRVVTHWADGPATAELPGRAQQWRDRLRRLRRPLPYPPGTQL